MKVLREKNAQRHYCRKNQKNTSADKTDDTVGRKKLKDIDRKEKLKQYHQRMTLENNKRKILPTTQWGRFEEK